MNTKHILTAAAIAFAGTGAFAFEPTQFNDLGGQQSRAEVKAELAQALASGALSQPSALYGEAPTQVPGVRSRDDVRAEARMAAQRSDFSALYTGA